jgi:rare lipoprotein A
VKHAVCLLVLLALVGCQPPEPPSPPHYVLGEAYEAGGVWYYPHETFDAQQTGLATVYAGSHPPLTTDGEAFDQSAMAGAHQTWQLPAVMRVTNLNNGLSTEIRVNDRGPDSPHRLVEVTARVAELLQFPPDGVAAVRLTVVGAPSHTLVEQLGGGATPKLDMASAPRGDVETADLPPPDGAQEGGGHQALETQAATPEAVPTGEAVPLRLPEVLTREAVGTYQLWVMMGTFSRYEFANLQRAKVAELGPRIEETRNGRDRTYQVRVGPFATPAQADAALDQVIGAGVTDARIVVE